MGNADHERMEIGLLSLTLCEKLQNIVAKKVKLFATITYL